MERSSPGYQLTGITVQPTLVTVFSSDPNLVDQLGGFVETEPVSLAGVTGDIQKNVGLSLPDGVSIVGEKTVTVRVSISPIENSIKVTRPVEITGLRQGLFAQASPDTVSVILNGPVPILDNLQPDDVRIVLDLIDMTAGTYQLTPEVLTSSNDIKVQSVLPDTIEVTISTTPPPTPQPTPVRLNSHVETYRRSCRAPQCRQVDTLQPSDWGAAGCRRRPTGHHAGSAWWRKRNGGAEHSTWSTPGESIPPNQASPSPFPRTRRITSRKFAPRPKWRPPVPTPSSARRRRDRPDPRRS